MFALLWQSYEMHRGQLQSSNSKERTWGGSTYLIVNILLWVILLGGYQVRVDGKAMCFLPLPPQVFFLVEILKLSIIVNRQMVQQAGTESLPARDKIQDDLEGG